MTLAEIAAESGLAARTVRFYIARGLLRGPVKGGRAAVYTAEHVARLERIQRLQTDGHTLSEIRRMLDGPSETEEAAPATAWWQHAIADDVVVWVKAGSSPWRTRQVHAAVEEFARRVRPQKEEEREIG